jgi:hypothetical protein
MCVEIDCDGDGLGDDLPAHNVQQCPRDVLAPKGRGVLLGSFFIALGPDRVVDLSMACCSSSKRPERTRATVSAGIVKMPPPSSKPAVDRNASICLM